jgi:hypothetical protein
MQGYVNSHTGINDLVNSNQINQLLDFYIHGSVHRNSILIRSKKTHTFKTVAAASGTGHSI